MGYVIKRPINGISINGDEYVCDESGSTMVFESEEKAKEFLKENGYDDDGMENEGIEIVEK